MKQLSRTHKLTSGKWLIAVPWDESDAIWIDLKKAFVQDKLPEEVRFLKVTWFLTMVFILGFNERSVSRLRVLENQKK